MDAGSRLNVLTHIRLASRQMRDMAEEVELPFLVSLLGMVILETQRIMQEEKGDA